MEDKDVIIIGGGPAGFMAAQRVSMLGGRATVLEKEKLGGICPIWGCIPMCFMDHCVEVIKSAKAAHLDGIDVGDVKIDYSRLISEKDKMIGGLVDGMEARLRSFGVEVAFGEAELVSRNEVAIKLADGTQETARAGKIIVTAGSIPRRYDIPGAYGPGVLTTRELLDLKELPKSLVVIGRGVAALELATVWANLGSEVSLLARKPRLLPNEDAELAEIAGQAIESDGVHLYAGVDVLKIEDGGQGKIVILSTGGKQQTVTAQHVVFALGQQPRVAGLGLEKAGIALEDGGIKTDDRMATSVAGVYAAGDITGGWMLASVAMKQGMVAADNAMGGSATIDYNVVPRFVRTIPPLASVGITEEEAREKGLNIIIGKSPFELNPKAKILKDSRGMVKIIAEADSTRLLGVHIIGIQSTELIHEAAALMKLKGTARDIAGLIHAHPCLEEALPRAATEILQPSRV